MGAFITNFQAPREMDELICCYEEEASNIDFLLDFEEYEDIYWTVPSYAEKGDLVFFLCAKTSVDKIKHVRRIARKEADKDLLDFIEDQVEKYEKYAGKIMAIGVVNDEPYTESGDVDVKPDGRSRWYANIEEIKLIKEPIEISRLSEHIKINAYGAITKLDETQVEMIINCIK